MPGFRAQATDHVRLRVRTEIMAALLEHSIPPMMKKNLVAQRPVVHRPLDERGPQGSELRLNRSTPRDPPLPNDPHGLVGVVAGFATWSEPQRGMRGLRVLGGSALF